MELSGRTVLVTGAAGTVGSVVARRLADEGMNVRAMSRQAAVASSSPPSTRTITAVQADLTDRDSLAAAVGTAELAVHCAAAVSTDFAACTATNVDGTRNLLDALARAGTRLLVHISTISVYDSRTTTSFDEQSPIWTEPNNAYGYTKAEAERLVTAARGGLPSVILRPVIVFSTHPRSRWGPGAFARARATREPLFHGAEMPYVHVDNLVEAVVLAARQKAAENRTYNVIDGYLPTRDYFEVVYGAIGQATPAISPDAPIYRFAGERIRRELGYAPPQRAREFLRELAALEPEPESESEPESEPEPEPESESEPESEPEPEPESELR
jgi:nucleoside-diphosphate-sugar epimerase